MAGLLNWIGDRLTATRTEFGPGRRIADRGAQHPCADLLDHPAFLGERDELVGPDRPARRMVPAHQRLEAADILAGGADDRLVGDPQLAAVERLAQVVLQHLPVRGLGVHRLFVEAMLAAPGRLGGVERQIGVADHRVGAGAARVADGDADRGADRHLVALDRVGARHLLDQGLGKRFQQAGLDDARQHRLEFVAAQASDLAVVAHDGLQPIGDLAQQRVADRVAERIVDVLEPVEVDQEQGAALLPARGIAQRFVERLAHHRPVRQAGQRIEARQAADFLFAAPLFGEVRADPAEAHEAALLVEDRIARQGPVDVLVGGGPDDDVGEGEAGRQVEAQRLVLFAAIALAGVDGEQIGELAAEQFLAAAIEIVGQLVRHVGQGAEVVGFPEPAAAGSFEFIDEVKRLAGVLLEFAGGGGCWPPSSARWRCCS